jgi:transposase-like protein
MVLGMKTKVSLTIREFFALYPSDEACLAHLFEARFGQGHTCGKCERKANWYRIKAERAYSCQWCGNHLHPTVGTPFEDSRTPLQLWFYAIYLFTTSRHGVPAKELERQLGVTYKTAWRMADQIRKHIANVDGEWPLEGEVEIDETYVGGYQEGMKGGLGKAVVLGMLQRGGEIMTKVVENNRKPTLLPIIKENVKQGTMVHTDTLRSYAQLSKNGYTHNTVNHEAKEYVRGRVHVNGLENFWKHLKGSINGTHMQVSKKHLAKYAKEFEFRFNWRERPDLMLPSLLSSFPQPST